MIPELRRDFNQRFTSDKYARFLTPSDERCGAQVKFRVCETPCFFPAQLVQTMQQAGAELIHQLVGMTSPTSRPRAAQIPAGFVTPHETARPLFLQVDFGLIRRRRLASRAAPGGNSGFPLPLRLSAGP